MATGVNFDENSKKILMGVDAIHRDSLINVALALVSKTSYYKTLTGVPPAELAQVADLSSLEDEISDAKTTKVVKKEAKKAPTGWDDFG